MNEKTLEQLMKRLRDEWDFPHRTYDPAWLERMTLAIAALEAAIANPPADSELDRLRMREPRREEMEAALGEANEAFYEGWTIRRCRHCRIPVAGGPTACEVCAATQDPDKNPWPPPKVAGAVGRLVEHLNANADDFNRWPMEMKSLIAAVEAERAGERVVKRPWRLKTGRMICAECQQDVPPKWLMCDNGDCPQYGKPWGKPRDLPSGEEVGG